MKIVLEHLTKQFPPRGRKAQEPVTAVSDFNLWRAPVRTGSLRPRRRTQ